MASRFPRFLLPLLAAIVVVALGTIAPVRAQQTYPKPVGFVNDFAGVLHPSIVQALENDLRRLQEETAAELAVVTVRTLGDASIEEYAVGLFEDWGIGQEGQDNGVLLLVAVEERKIRIEVGYGLEPVITDGRAGRIIRQDITPALREGDYDTGIVQGAASLIGLVREGQPAPPLEDNPVRERFAHWGWLLWPLGFLSLYVLGFMARTKEVVLGGLWGAGIGGFLGLLLGGLVAVVISIIGLGLLGLFLDWVLSANYKTLKRSGRPTTFGPSWGGWRGTGGHWGGGGGFGRGGFGGFSGGRSGGGGATGGF